VRRGEPTGEVFVTTTTAPAQRAATAWTIRAATTRTPRAATVRVATGSGVPAAQETMAEIAVMGPLVAGKRDTQGFWWMQLKTGKTAPERMHKKLLAAMHATQHRAALQQKQMEWGLLKVGAKPKGGALPGATKGSSGARSVAPGTAAGRLAEKKARKKRHPRDVEHDEDAKGKVGGGPPTPQAKCSGTGRKGVKDGGDKAKTVGKPAACPSCARMVYATSAAATNNGRDNPTFTVSNVSTELSNVNVYDVSTLEHLEDVRKNFKKVSVTRQRSAMPPSISASFPSMVDMSHTTFSKDWKPHPLHADGRYNFKLCLLTAPVYEVVVAAQANVNTIISVEQLKVAEGMLMTGTLGVSSINVELPSAFCL